MQGSNWPTKFLNAKRNATTRGRASDCTSDGNVLSAHFDLMLLRMHWELRIASRMRAAYSICRNIGNRAATSARLGQTFSSAG